VGRVGHVWCRVCPKVGSPPHSVRVATSNAVPATSASASSSDVAPRFIRSTSCARSVAVSRAASSRWRWCVICAASLDSWGLSRFRLFAMPRPLRRHRPTGGIACGSCRRGRCRCCRGRCRGRAGAGCRHPSLSAQPGPVAWSPSCGMVLEVSTQGLRAATAYPVPVGGGLSLTHCPARPCVPHDKLYS
jgi:hypothetical protein